MTIRLNRINMYTRKEDKKLMRTYSLKAMRINLGLTMEEASKLIGISKYTLLNYEKFRTTPDNEILTKIMNAYNVSYNEIRFIPNKKEKLAVKR